MPGGDGEPVCLVRAGRHDRDRTVEAVRRLWRFGSRADSGAQRRGCRIRSSETGRPVRAVSDGPLQQSEHPAGRRVCLVLPAE